MVAFSLHSEGLRQSAIVNYKEVLLYPSVIACKFCNAQVIGYLLYPSSAKSKWSYSQENKINPLLLSILV